MKVKSRHPHCEGKLKVFVTSRPTLKEWLKEYLETERKKKETWNIRNKERAMERVKIWVKYHGLSFSSFPSFYWLHQAACRILVPPPGIEPRPWK